MAKKEAKRTCDHLTGLLESKLNVKFCETRKDPRCAKRLELEVDQMGIFKSEIETNADNLIDLYLMDPKDIRPLLIQQALKVLDYLAALHILYGTRFQNYGKQGRCYTYFLVRHIELTDIYRGYKRYLCYYIFNDLPERKNSLLTYLSPRTELEDLESREEVLIVELSDLPAGEGKNKKERFEMLLEAGFFELESMHHRSKREKLQRAAEIVGCSLRYVQDLLDEMKDQGKKQPFSRGGELGLLDNFRDPSQN